VSTQVVETVVSILEVWVNCFLGSLLLDSGPVILIFALQAAVFVLRGFVDMSSSHLARTRSLKQSWFAKLLRLDNEPDDRRYCVEPLERRELMAADLNDFLGSTFNDDTSSESGFMSALTQHSHVTTQTEGENGQDLVAFARALRDAGVQLFGADWNDATSQQLRLFEDGAIYLSYTDVTNPNRTPNSIATSENITTYPTWKFPNQVNPSTGVLTLAQISTLSGIAIPTANSPFLDTLPNQSVELNSPLHIPVNAYDPNGNTLTVTVQSSNPSAITAEVVQGGRSARIATNFGDMTFRLFENEAGRAAARFIELANQGFYNTTSSRNMTFHRIKDDFVIQGGDPNGNGSGGSTLPDFDDIFNVNLLHNRSGVLSYAKSDDDTNNSQFFITEGAQSALDSNHSVFGQLVEGEEVRENISETTATSDNAGTPLNPPIIQSITIFDDVENGLVRLRSVGAAGQTSTITITVTDSAGFSTSRAFTATVAADSVDTPPFLSDFNNNLTTTTGQPVTVQLSSQDAEGNAVSYFTQSLSNSSAQVSVSATGLVSVTPPANFTGTFNFTVGVRAAGASSSAPTDLQRVNVTVNAPVTTAPTSVDLATVSDSGSNNTDNITNVTSMTFAVNGTTTGATVELLRNGTVIASQVATGTTTNITTTAVSTAGNGTSTITARQTLNSSTSAASPSLSVTFDSTAPATIASSAIPTTALVGRALALNFNHPEETTSGMRYEFTTAPTGATVNATSGVVTWTPTLAQVGNQNFTLQLTDIAGNTTTQNFTIAVSEPPLVEFSIQFVDTNNNAITELTVGQNFKVRLFATDIRDEDADGVFSAFLDLLFNSTLVERVGTTSITYLNGFDASQSGDFNTAGVVNEIGAGRSSSTSPGNAPQLFAEITMRTIAAGQATFTTQAADEVGSEVSLYSRPGEVPVGQITFESANISIGRTFDANDDVLQVNEDSSNNTLNVLQNETIRSGQVSDLTIVSVTSADVGTVSLVGGNIIYTPPADYNGDDTFEYTVRDANGAEDTATVTVEVMDINDPPVAVADSFNVAQNSTSNFLDVLANDSTDEDEELVVQSVGSSSNGATVTRESDGSGIRYTPRTGFQGFDTISYTLSDGRGGTVVSSFTVNVGSAVPPPTAVNDSFTVVEDASTDTFNVLSNDVPSVTNETLSIESVSTTGSGSVARTSDNRSITYAPKANFNGTEIVTYVLVGSNGGRTTGTVTFTVTPVNDSPDAINDSLFVNTTANQNVDVLANDVNVDSGETLTITSITTIPSTQGTLSISSDSRRLIYSAPRSDFQGTVTFSYTISDGNGRTDTATVTLNVSSFTPRSIGGTLEFASASLNGFEVGGLKVFISGTSDTGEVINREVVTTDEGKFQADNLPPGVYTVRMDPLAFRDGSAQVLTIDSNPNDGNSLNNVFTIGQVQRRYITFRDFLGSAAGRGFTVAAQVGSTQQWTVANGAWRGFRSITTSLNSAGTELTIRTTSQSNATNSETVTIADNDLIQLRGTEGNVRYYAIVGEPADFDLPTPSAADIEANTDNDNINVSSASRLSSSSDDNEAASDLALQDFDADEQSEDEDNDLSDFLGSLDVEDNLTV
jgi:large repetitive protein